MTTRRFFSCLAVALGVIVAFNIFIALKVDSVPKMMMRQMRAMPKLDILFLGNSVMADSLDPHAFLAAWPPSQPTPSIYNAGLAQSSGVEHYLLARQAYLHHASIPCLVYGFYDLELTERPAYSWTKLTGNRAMAYSPADATLAASLYAPGSTLEKWRFNLIGAIPMLREHSQLWKFVELFRRQLGGIGRPPEKTTRHGRAADITKYIFPDMDRFSSDCEFAAQHSAPFIPPVQELLKLAQKDKTRVFIVEMPMISDHRDRIYATTAWQNYRAYLQQRCQEAGVTYINASDWVPNDADFMDNLHLSSTGADLFSAKMAQYLSASWSGN